MIHLRELLVSIVTVGTLCCGSPTVAQNLSPQSGAVPALPATVDLKPGYVLVLRFDRQVATVVIGDPTIVDASVNTVRSITLVAKRVGETNLIGIDDKGNDFFHATVLVGGGETGRVQMHTKRQVLEYTAYRCNQNGCQRLEDRFDRPTTLRVIPSQGCQNPDDIAADGTRCGDRASGARPSSGR
jgi:hypothetical protein